ncbi:hypothetical protein Tco_0226269 [Tanacetum coccineum]
MRAKGKKISGEQSAIYRQNWERFGLAGLLIGGGGGTLGGGDIGEFKQPLVDGDVEEVGDLGVLVSSLLRSMNNCFGGMMLIFDLLKGLEMEALVDAMEVYDG